MENYNANITWGTHTIEVTLQQWGYKNIVTFNMGGNTQGASILESGLYDILDNTLIENPGNLRRLPSDGEEWFGITLVNDKGEEINVEEEVMYLNDWVVGIKIINYIEDKGKIR